MNKAKKITLIISGTAFFLTGSLLTAGLAGGAAYILWNQNHNYFYPYRSEPVQSEQTEQKGFDDLGCDQKGWN